MTFVKKCTPPGAIFWLWTVLFWLTGALWPVLFWLPGALQTVLFWLTGALRAVFFWLTGALQAVLFWLTRAKWLIPWSQIIAPGGVHFLTKSHWLLLLADSGTGLPERSRQCIYWLSGVLRTVKIRLPRELWSVKIRLPRWLGSVKIRMPRVLRSVKIRLSGGLREVNKYLLIYVTGRNALVGQNKTVRSQLIAPGGLIFFTKSHWLL